MSNQLTYLDRISLRAQASHSRPSLAPGNPSSISSKTLSIMNSVAWKSNFHSKMLVMTKKKKKIKKFKEIKLKTKTVTTSSQSSYTTITMNKTLSGKQRMSKRKMQKLQTITMQSNKFKKKS